MTELRDNEVVVIRARRTDISWGADHIRLYGLAKQINGSIIHASAEPLIFKTRHEAEIVEPFLSITEQEAQILMNDLWDSGIRPSEAKGNAGQMATTQKHLDDMRKIAFYKLGIKEELKNDIV